MADRITNPVPYRMPGINRLNRNSAAYLTGNKYLGAGLKKGKVMRSDEQKVVEHVMNEAPLIKYLSESIAANNPYDKVVEIAANDSDNPSGYSDPARYSGPDILPETRAIEAELIDPVLEVHHQTGAGFFDFVKSAFNKVKSVVSKAAPLISKVVEHAPSLINSAKSVYGIAKDVNANRDLESIKRNFGGLKDAALNVAGITKNILSNPTRELEQVDDVTKAIESDEPTENLAALSELPNYDDTDYSVDFRTRKNTSELTPDDWADDFIKHGKNFNDKKYQSRGKFNPDKFIALNPLNGFDEDDYDFVQSIYDAAMKKQKGGAYIGGAYIGGNRQGGSKIGGVLDLLDSSGRLLGGFRGSVLDQDVHPDMVTGIKNLVTGLQGSGLSKNSAQNVVKHALNIAPLLNNNIPFHVALPHSVMSDLSHGGSIHGISDVDVDEVNSLFEDKIGGGFFDDLWSGIKSVGSTALELAPHLIPLALGAGVKRGGTSRSEQHTILKNFKRYPGEIIDINTLDSDLEGSGMSGGDIHAFDSSVMTGLDQYSYALDKFRADPQKMISVKRALLKELRDLGLRKIKLLRAGPQVASNYKLELKEFLSFLGKCMTKLKTSGRKGDLSKIKSMVALELRGLSSWLGGRNLFRKTGGSGSVFAPNPRYLTAELQPSRGSVLPMNFRSTDEIYGPQNPWS